MRYKRNKTIEGKTKHLIMLCVSRPFTTLRLSCDEYYYYYYWCCLLNLRHSPVCNLCLIGFHTEALGYKSPTLIARCHLCGENGCDFQRGDNSFQSNVVHSGNLGFSSCTHLRPRVNHVTASTAPFSTRDCCKIHLFSFLPHTNKQRLVSYD